jgi:hypothetical protein
LWLALSAPILYHLITTQQEYSATVLEEQERRTQDPASSVHNAAALLKHARWGRPFKAAAALSRGVVGDLRRGFTREANAWSAEESQPDRRLREE